MPKPHKYESPRKPTLKRRGQLIKLVGGALLLGSFISQNFLYDRWDAEHKWLVDSLEKSILVDHGVALNELLYLELQPTPDAFNQQIKLIKLRKAAEAYATSVSIGLSLADVTDFTRFNQLHQDSQAISDYRSYVEYKRSFNEIETAAHVSINEKIAALELKRRLAQKLYLVFYILGGLSVLIGEILIYRFGD